MRDAGALAYNTKAATRAGRMRRYSRLKLVLSAAPVAIGTTGLAVLGCSGETGEEAGCVGCPGCSGC